MAVQKQEPLDGERQFADILAAAATLYKDRSGEALTDFTTPPMKSVDDLKQELARQNDGFAAFRAKRQNIFDAVGAALKPIELVGDIVSGAASDAFAPAQNIYAAVLFLVNAAHNVTSAYDSIVELFGQLKVGQGRMLPRFSYHC